MKIYWDTKSAPTDFVKYLVDNNIDEPKDCDCDCGRTEEAVTPWMHMTSKGFWLMYEWECQECEAQVTEAIDETSVYTNWGATTLGWWLQEQDW